MGFNGISWDMFPKKSKNPNSFVLCPLVNIQKAIENGPVEIVDFPINSMVIFYSYVKLPEGRYDLVGGLEHFLFHIYIYIYWESSSQLTNIF